MKLTKIAVISTLLLASHTGFASIDCGESYRAGLRQGVQLQWCSDQLAYLRADIKSVKYWANLAVEHRGDRDFYVREMNEAQQAVSEDIKRMKDGGCEVPKGVK